MAGPTSVLYSGNRFSPRGLRDVYALPAVASVAAVTRPEIVAGTDLTGGVAAMSGFAEAANFTEVPDLGSQVAGKILDGISIADSMITFYGNDNANDASKFFVRGVNWYILVPWYGDPGNARHSGLSRSVTVGTTSASAAITSTAAFDVNNDVGASITGAGIPVGATIASVTSTSAATLSANATATGSPAAVIQAVRPYDLFYCQVGSVAPHTDITGPHQIDVAFSVLTVPTKRATLPA